MANGTEVQSLKELISERVGKELISLIPPEQWDKLIQEQIHQFLTHKAPAIVQEELNKSLRERIARVLANDKQWDAKTQQFVMPLVTEAITKASPEIFSAMLAPIMSGFLQELSSRMFQNRGY